MFSKALYLLGGLAVLGAGVAVAIFAGRFADDASTTPVTAPLVEVARPEVVALPPAVVETGFVRAAERVDIVPEISGRVVEIGDHFAIGGRFSEGDLVLRLSSTTIETEVTQAEARLARAQAAEAQASAELVRQRELVASDVTSEAQLERVAADAAAATAEVAQARAALDAARTRLEDMTLRAPMDALVIAENASPGQLLQVGETVGTVVAADVAEVRTGLAEQDFRRLREAGPLEGREVEIMVDSDGGGDGAGEAIPGTITAFAPALEGSARTVEVVVEVEDPFSQARGLILNSVVTVSIPLPGADRQLYRLPVGALQTGRRLWRVTDENRLEDLEAVIERRSETGVFVSADALSADDRVLLTQIPNPLPGLEVRLRSDGGTARPEDGA